MSESNKMAERMSMNVEELQWRIRNNFELPVDIYTKQKTSDQSNNNRKPDLNSSPSHDNQQQVCVSLSVIL